MDVQGICDNLNRIRRAQGSIGPDIKPTRIRMQIRETSRPFQYLERVEVKLLVPMNNKGQESRHYQGPDQFQPGDIVYAGRDVRGFIVLYPFKMAGAGFELIRDAIEGKHYEFI